MFLIGARALRRGVLRPCWVRGLAISRAPSMPLTCWFLCLSDPRGRACRARHGTPAPAKAGCQKGVGLRAWPFAVPGLATGERRLLTRACPRTGHEE